MRFSPLPVAALAISLFAPALPAHAEIWSVYGINGNDTGGIIPWSPALRAYGYREAAQDHCRGYKKRRAHHEREGALRRLCRLRLRIPARLRSGWTRRLVDAADVRNLSD